MALVRNRLPFRLGDLPSVAVSPFHSKNVRFDFAIGGIPFISAVAPDRPYQRETAPYRKDQFDNGQDPGEQSIVTWWLRSQGSFHGGTGLDFEIPYSAFQPRFETRFADSLGVDVWTPGRVSLLPQMTRNKAAGAALIALGVYDANGVDSYLHASGTVLSKVLDGGTSTTLTWGGAGTLLSLAFDGARYYAADSTGIYRDTLPTSGAGAGALLWNTGNSKVVIAWAKQRLMAAIGPSLYELVGGAPAVLPTAKYTHPVSGWTWTSFAEGPTAIYAGGYGGTESTITKLTLASDGTVPTLTSATEVARMPPGEIVTSLLGTLGAYLIIGTNRGVRVATIDSNGDLNFGGLTVRTSDAVYGLAAKDRFVYAGVKNALAGFSGAYRIDLATQNEFGLYAYAKDLQTKVTGNVSGLTWFGRSGRLIIAVDSQGSYLEVGDGTLETTGFLTTERIRFHTMDKKLFKFLQPRITEPMSGSVSVSQIDARGNETSLITFSSTASSQISEVAISGNTGPQEFMQFKFSLAPAIGNLVGPSFLGYQVKALPAAKRQRQYMIPLYCMDREKDRNGVTGGQTGWAQQRLIALETLEESGDTVLFQDLNTGESRLVVIDKITEVRQAPDSRTDNGGILVALLRAVT